MANREERECHVYHCAFEFAPGISAETPQYCGFVQGDVIGLVALDFILRLGCGCAVNVAFVTDSPSMHFDDFSAHAPGLRIPAHVIANFELCDHGSVLASGQRAKNQ
jgi:hypothetical protein